MNDDQPGQSIDTANTVVNEQDTHNQLGVNGTSDSADGTSASNAQDQGQESASGVNGNNTNDQVNPQADMDTQASSVDAAGTNGQEQPAQVDEAVQVDSMDAARQEQALQADAAEDTSGQTAAPPAHEPRLEDVAPNASMEDLLRASERQYRTLKHGDVIEGSIMQLGRDEILVDIGAKTEGIIPSHELQSLTAAEREAMQVGDKVLVSVVQPENNEGHAVLSLDRARQEKSWRDLQRKFEAGEVLQAKVSGHNKGGLLVNLEGVRGFVPSSQISAVPSGEAEKQAHMARLQNQVIPLKIIEINRNRNRLILSERQALQEQRESMRSRLLRELEPGQIRPGTVTSLADFGAFVDIGGADGLIHLSELSWKRVNNPREVLKEGDHINVYVLSVDPTERKIALSLKRTQVEPWSTITDNYHLGQVVKGTITQLTSFGAFARLEDGIEGLIHVSELAEGRVAHPSNVVKVGDVLDLKVIRIDPAKRRIGLSLKRMAEDREGGPEEGETEQVTRATESEAPGQQSQPAPAPQTPTREKGQEREERSGRQAQPRQPRAQTPAAQAAARQEHGQPAGEEPMGALAHALAAHAQAGGLTVTDKEEAAPPPKETATPEGEPAPEQTGATPEQSLPEPQASEPSEVEATAEAQDVTPPDSAPVATEAEAADTSDVTDTGETADTVVTDDSAGAATDTVEGPEASMPSAAETNMVEAEASEASGDLQPLEDTEANPSGAELGIPDMQEESGSEGMPSEADQGASGEK